MGPYWVCDACLSLNDERNGSCYKCHVKRGHAAPQPIIPGATPPPSASAFYGTGPAAPRGPDLLTATIIGSAATAAITFLWIFIAERSSILFAIGFLRATWWTGIAIGLIVGFAGTYAGQRRSLALALLATSLAIASTTGGIYEIVSAVLLIEAGRPAAWLVPFAPLDQVVARVRVALSADPVTLPMVWLIPPIAAWTVSFRRLVGPVPRIHRD